MRAKGWQRILMVALCFGGVTGAANAEPGFYVTASLGRGEDDPASAGMDLINSQSVFHLEPDQVTVDTGDTAWSLGVGYRLNSYLSAELEYVDFGSSEIEELYTMPDLGLPFPTPTTNSLSYSTQVSGPAVSLLGKLPLTDRLGLFVRGGALFGARDIKLFTGTFRETFASTVWLAGAGIDCTLSDRWSLRAEYQQTGKFDETLFTGGTDLRRATLSVLFAL